MSVPGPNLTLYRRSRTGVVGIGYSELRIYKTAAVPHFIANCGRRTHKFNIRRLGRNEAFRRAVRARAEYEKGAFVACPGCRQPAGCRKSARTWRRGKPRGIPIMTSTNIARSITRGIELKRLIADATKELNEIKADLIAEAESRDQEHKPTEGGGWSWESVNSAGELVRVTEPARKLKSTFNPEAKNFPKIKEAAGNAWSLLFLQVPAYKPVEDFRDKAVAHLGRGAAKLIKLCTTDSETTVNFEVARKGDA